MTDVTQRYVHEFQKGIALYMEKTLDLYTDYLLSSFGQTSATGLSRLLEGDLSHDQVTRFLSQPKQGSKELWQQVKPLVREHQSSDACLVFDDVIIEKPHTDENAMICWHYDHSTGRTVKGVNMLNAFYHSQSGDKPLRVPVAYDIVHKEIAYCDLKTRKEKRTSDVTKNERLRAMVAQSVHNQLKFKYVLADSWFGSADNMRFVAKKKKFFIFDMKTNRQVALSEANRTKSSWSRIDSLEIPDNTPVKVWLKDLEFPVMLTKQVFTNKNQQEGVRFLVSNDFSLSDDDFLRLYKKRWSVEEYHKSLKQNTAIAASPTRKVNTQSNHIFCSVVAYVKLEAMKFNTALNHFAIKSKIYLASIKAAYQELTELKSKHATA